MILYLILFSILAFLASLAWARWVTTVIVRQHQAALLSRHGKLCRSLGPGRHRIFGSGYEVEHFDLRRTEIQVVGQEFLTADKAGLKVSAVLEYHIADPALYVGAAANPVATLYGAVQVALRDVIGGLALDAVLDRSNDLSAELIARVAPFAGGLGLAVNGLAVKDLMIGGDLRRVFTEALTVRQQSLIALEKARAEAAAIRTLANAARVFETHPALLQLKFLQTLEKADGGISQPLALGTAGQWLDFLKK
ncbi:slipin family protein [Luteolibacter marinus]|uniref:slipin family protein n=1 Tax=Luteolibacter marinus TaxID=2776705 RepID=UPI00186783C5|nr:slipin family protein [Luteolibacter marinus]